MTSPRLCLVFVAACVVALGTFGCDTGKVSAPTGTPTDPVETCAKVGQVCRYNGQQLGVCHFRDGTDNPGDRFVCLSQH